MRQQPLLNNNSTRSIIRYVNLESAVMLKGIITQFLLFINMILYYTICFAISPPRKLISICNRTPVWRHRLCMLWRLRELHEMFFLKFNIDVHLHSACFIKKIQTCRHFLTAGRVHNLQHSSNAFSSIKVPVRRTIACRHRTFAFSAEMVLFTIVVVGCN
jgi:hypothetical protein